MNHDAFVEEYEKLFATALTNGVRYRTRAELPGSHDRLSPRDLRRFRADCHRGYDKGQRWALTVLENIGDPDSEETEWQSLHVRKVMDAVAYTMFGMTTHPLRRVAYLEAAPAVQMDVVQQAVAEATRRNAQSRQSFTLANDLTTGIHVADLLTIDFRGGQGMLRFEEMKSGKVNAMLLERLADYEISRSAVPLIDNDELIGERHKRQAKRMLRQQIRMQDVAEVLRSDQGTDLALERPIRVSRDWAREKNYDDFLDGLLDTARERGYSAATYQWCLHIGVGFEDTPDAAQARARRAMGATLRHFYQAPPPPVEAVEAEWGAEISIKNRLRVSDLVSSNLANPSSRPFPTWSLSRENRSQVVRRRLVIIVAFDVLAFVALGRELGLPMNFTSKRNAAQVGQQIGPNLPTWGRRALTYALNGEEVTVLSGMISRFVNDLASPATFIREVKRISAP